MDVLRTDHSAVNGVEWYAQTLNDALQTQCAVLRAFKVPILNADIELDTTISTRLLEAEFSLEHLFHIIERNASLEFCVRPLTPA
ncbi:hypothetical protein TNCV_1201341 [Trichonephila clavipes]|nr:hypothetical protein TNCV_1201341 [Trichonephila clavipes]